MILIEGIMEPGARCKHVVMYSYWPGVLKAERALFLDCDIWILMRTYISLYIYIYFSLSLSLVLEALANNRRISLVCVSRCLLLGEDIDPPSSVFVILCRYTYKCRNHDRLDWSNLQDWIFENWIRLLSIDWNDQNWVLEFWKESEELRVVDGLDWKN